MTNVEKSKWQIWKHIFFLLQVPFWSSQFFANVENGIRDKLHNVNHERQLLNAAQSKCIDFSPNEAIFVGEFIFYNVQCRWMNILCFTMSLEQQHHEEYGLICFNHIRTPPKHKKTKQIKSFPSEDRRWCTLATGGTASEASEKPAELGRADGVAPGRNGQNCPWHIALVVQQLLRKASDAINHRIVVLLLHSSMYIGTWNHHVYTIFIYIYI